MDKDRKPAAVLHSEPEVISPVHASDEGTSSGTVQLDQSNRNLPPTTVRIDSNFDPSAATSENFHDTSSMQPLTQPVLPELNSERRQTRNESELDWIPEEEKVSLYLFYYYYKFS
jgi:hypothetical protein